MAQSDRILSYDLAATLSEETALASVEGVLRGQRIARRSLSFSLSPANVEIELGDAVELTLPEGGGAAGTFIVERIDEGDVRRVEARHHAPAPPTNHGGEPQRRSDDGQPSAAFAPVVHFLDLPRYRAGEATSFARIAAYCRPWRQLTVSSSPGSEGYRVRTSLQRPARIGVLTQALQPGPLGRFDRANGLTLQLFFGGLSSVDEQAVLNGENLLAVKADNGIWEVIGFMDAAEVAPGVWKLTGLLRGLGGTEDALNAGAAAGAAVVVLDEAVVPLALSTEERGRSLNWLVESAGAAGGRSGPFVFSGGIRSETPLAPVHVRGKRTTNGIEIGWTRRGRLDADNWDALDIPVDEPFERYRVEILDGNTTRRSVEVAAPAFTYGAAEEVADFGAPQPNLRVRIRQMGRAVALGIATTAEIQL